VNHSPLVHAATLVASSLFHVGVIGAISLVVVPEPAPFTAPLVDLVDPELITPSTRVETPLPIAPRPQTTARPATTPHRHLKKRAIPSELLIEKPVTARAPEPHREPEEMRGSAQEPFVASPPPSPDASASTRTGLVEASELESGMTGPTDAPPTSLTALTPGDGVAQIAYPRGGYQVLPSYPAAARRLGAQGTTLLRVYVADDGRVGPIVIEQSAGHPDLDQAAIEAVRRWRFEPARKGKARVAMWVLLPVEFRLTPLR